MKRFNYVYVITNLINNKQYIGDHSTNNLDDGYLGSGTYLKNSISKHGKEHFKREILEQFETREEAFNKQEKYINEYNTLSPNGYNISPKGGYGINCSYLSEETIEKIRLTQTGKKYSKEINNSKGRKGKDNKWFNQKHSKISIKKISDKAKKRSQNPMLGKNHSDESKKIMKLQKMKFHNIKITKKDLIEIKKLYKQISNVQIALKFNLPYNTIRSIFKGKYDWIYYEI